MRPLAVYCVIRPYVAADCCWAEWAEKIEQTKIYSWSSRAAVRSTGRFPKGNVASSCREKPLIARSLPSESNSYTTWPDKDLVSAIGRSIPASDTAAIG